MRRNSAAWAVGLLGLAALTLAIPVGVAMSDVPGVTGWTAHLREGANTLQDAIPAPIVHLGRLAKPLLVLVTAGLFLTCLRRSRRGAVAFAAVVVLTNGSIQLLKRILSADAPVLATVTPLSGHVGLVAGLVLGWLVVAPRRWAVPSALLAAAAIAAVSSAVLLAGWHTLGQVGCSVALAAGWALLCRGLLIAMVPNLTPDRVT